MRSVSMISAGLLAALLPAALGCDIVPDEYALKRSFVIDTIDASTDTCLEQESCLSGPGLRTILRFDSHVANHGYSDCTIGWTPRCPRGDDSNVPDEYPFTYDPCHKHWHFTGFSEYTMIDMDSNEVVAAGQKNGLCLMDVFCTSGRKKFTCQDQGISPGCTDIYNKGLDCQWVDITDLPNGTESGIYRFIWNNNAGRLIEETDYSNNQVEVIVDLSKVPMYNTRESDAPNQCPLTATYSPVESSSDNTREDTGRTTVDWDYYFSLDDINDRRSYRLGCVRNGDC